MKELYEECLFCPLFTEGKQLFVRIGASNASVLGMN
jgi:hypothetical protein